LLYIQLFWIVKMYRMHLHRVSCKCNSMSFFCFLSRNSHKLNFNDRLQFHDKYSNNFDGIVNFSALFRKWRQNECRKFVNVNTRLCEILIWRGDYLNAIKFVNYGMYRTCFTEPPFWLASDKNLYLSPIYFVHKGSQARCVQVKHL